MDYVDYLKAKLSFAGGQTLSSYYQASPSMLSQQIDMGFDEKSIGCQ
ncbi:hypothetical protein [Endozoicomonas numazuensis]|nr:hypothetical protein [Endozoicomonas numazuensis]